MGRFYGRKKPNIKISPIEIIFKLILFQHQVRVNITVPVSVPGNHESKKLLEMTAVSISLGFILMFGITVIVFMD
jgi:hypothetical protein